MLRIIKLHRVLILMSLLILLVACRTVDPTENIISTIEPADEIRVQITPQAPQIIEPQTTNALNRVFEKKKTADFILKIPTPVNDLQNPEQSQQMMARVKELQSEGYLSKEIGNFYRLPDFDASWAQINYYDWLPTGYEPKNFVIQADVEWQSASESANWWNSGCGFVFRLNARGDHYLVLLGLDGWVYLYRNLDKTLTNLGAWYYDDVEKTAGSAKIMLVADNAWISVFIDDQPISKIEDATLSSGLLGYALASGTNKDFGIRCRLTNVELCEVE